MNTIVRDKDVILGNNDLEHLHTFKNFPVFMGCTNVCKDEDQLHDMSWFISKESGMIQLNPLLPLDVVYSSEHGSGTVGKSWDEHHQSFAEFVCKYDVNSVLEIGGLHGILSKKSKVIKDIYWTIIEPNPILSDDIDVRVIRGFFDENFKSDSNYDCIIHSHVLEHIYDVDTFMKSISKFLTNGYLIFSVPNMDVMIDSNYTNCINFEHTILIGEIHIEFLLSKYNFEIVEKEYYKKDHSIFYCAKRIDNINSLRIPEGTYDRYKTSFTKYIDSHINDVNKINKIVRETDLPVFLFGAHVFSQYLISFGLDANKIKYLLDNDVNKEDKRLYGTNLISKTPKILKDFEESIVILRAGVYNDEVRNDIVNINKKVIFI